MTTAEELIESLIDEGNVPSGAHKTLTKDISKFGGKLIDFQDKESYSVKFKSDNDAKKFIAGPAGADLSPKDYKIKGSTLTVNVE